MKVNPKLYRGLAAAAAFRGEWQSAENYYRAHLTEVDDEDLDAWTDLAVVRYRMESDYDAQHILHMVELNALRYGPAARARAILGLIQLGRGDFANGWRNYADHYNVTDQHATDYDPLPEIPTWTGGELAGHTLLIRGEQGIGDELQWLSLVPLLIEKFAPAVVVLECNPKLLNLFSETIPWVIPRTIPAQERARVATLQTPIAAIGQYLIKSAADFPRRPSWIKADVAPLHDRLFCWDELARRRIFTIGICWSSSRQDKDQTAYAPAADWQAISTIPGVQFVPLQGLHTADAQLIFSLVPSDARPHLIVPGFDLYADLDTQAALIKYGVDLVIGPPNTTTYLAAALGVETWVLSFKREWILHGESSPPWFPTMHIFTKPWQQPAADFMREIANNLQQQIKGRAPWQKTK